MKFKNVKLGQEVKVKSGDKNKNSPECLEGMVGTVVYVDEYCYLKLTVRIDIGGGDFRWVSHKDIKIARDID